MAEKERKGRKEYQRKKETKNKETKNKETYISLLF
jgi:stalled ribosome alternative rescue factor ArfA